MPPAVPPRVKVNTPEGTRRQRTSAAKRSPARTMNSVGTVISPSEPRRVVVADDGGRGDARDDDHRRQLAEPAQRVAPGEGQEGRRLVEGAEAGHAERELAPVLVPGAGQREGDEAAEEGDVGRAAVGQQMERAEEAIDMTRGWRVMRYTPRGVGSPGTTPAGLGLTRLATSITNASPMPTYIAQWSPAPRCTSQSHRPACLCAKKVPTSGTKKANATSE